MWQKDSPCIVCSVFGSPSVEGKLRFYDARINKTYRYFKQKLVKSTYQQERVMLYVMEWLYHEKRKIATDQMLFDMETLEQFMGCEFVAKIDVLSDLTDEEKKLLRFACEECLLAIGADKSRGLGHLEAKLKGDEEDDKADTPIDFDGNLKITLIPQEYVRVSNTKTNDNYMDSMHFMPGSSVRG